VTPARVYRDLLRAVRNAALRLDYLGDDQQAAALYADLRHLEQRFARALRANDNAETA
jgi:hypothetical protein